MVSQIESLAVNRTDGSPEMQFKQKVEYDKYQKRITFCDIDFY